MLLIYLIELREQKDCEKSAVFSSAFKFTYSASKFAYSASSPRSWRGFCCICNTVVIYAFTRLEFLF